MNDDSALLHQYAQGGSETAFAELVRRHLDVVYNTALRRTDGQAHLAADVTQHVFTDLARKARQLADVEVLGAWLHTASRNAAIDLMIAEKRRRTRETEALAMSTHTGTNEPSPDWDRLRPVLDTAIDDLGDQDRTAIVLRFLEHRSFAAVGSVLRVSEDAARMRTDRALDKLRGQLERRGITSTTAALAAAVAAQPVASAPIGLAASIAALSAPAMGGGAAWSGSSFLLTLMSTKIVVSTAIVALLCLALGRYTAPTAAAPSGPVVVRTTDERTAAELVALRQENVQLRADLGRTKSEMEQLEDKAAKLSAALSAPPPITSLAPLPSDPAAMSKLRTNNLRQIGNARDQFIAQNGRAPTSLIELIGEGKLIPRLNVAGEDYSQLSLEPEGVLVLKNPDGTTLYYATDNVKPGAMQAAMAAAAPAQPRAKTDDDIRVEELVARVTPFFNAAAMAFQAATGKRASKPTDVIRYFNSTQEAADFMDAYQAREDLAVARRAAGQ